MISKAAPPIDRVPNTRWKKLKAMLSWIAPAITVQNIRR